MSKEHFPTHLWCLRLNGGLPLGESLVSLASNILEWIYLFIYFFILFSPNLVANYPPPCLLDPPRPWRPQLGSSDPESDTPSPSRILSPICPNSRCPRHFKCGYLSCWVVEYFWGRRWKHLWLYNIGHFHRCDPILYQPFKCIKLLFSLLINKEQDCFWILNAMWNCRMCDLLMVVGFWQKRQSMVLN